MFIEKLLQKIPIVGIDNNFAYYYLNRNTDFQRVINERRN